jgi:hypothetical protein
MALLAVLSSLVVLDTQPAGADTASFTSSQIGTSGTTPTFAQSGNWTMSWNFNCAAFGSAGNFQVNVNQPSGDLTIDNGPNELAASGSGTDYYTDTGTFSLSVNSECDWSITVSPSSASPIAGSASFTSTGIGDTGDSPQFSESTAWNMAWSYDCSNFGSDGNFQVFVVQPPGDLNDDEGPNELGPSGSGTDTYTDTGVFSLAVNSECQWSITVGAGSTPPSPPGPPSPGLPVQRIFGEDAIGTSIAVSQAEFLGPGTAHAVVLARSDYFSDALAGGPLAAALGGPLLITPGASQSTGLDSRVQLEIQRVLPQGATVYVLGGDLALSPGIDATLESLGYTVVRLAGTDEFDTAVRIANEMGNPSTIFEATGLNFADALSAVPAAINAHGAILLTNGNVQSPETAAYIGAHPTDTRFAIGGPLAAAGADPFATAVYGQDLFATSAAVATYFFPSATSFGAATGLNFPDALSGGVFMGSPGHVGPVLLVQGSLPLPNSVAAYIDGDTNMTGGYLFGGPLAVGDDVQAAL